MNRDKNKKRRRSQDIKNRSQDILDRARKSVCGGASSTMRVLGYHLPLVIERAEAARIWDIDGNELIDMNMAFGPSIFGHRSPLVVDAIRRELDNRGIILGFPHELSHLVAELVKKSFPSIDRLRFASTGTEVSQTAIRLARAYSGREYIVLFEGHYHGSCDAAFHCYHATLDELEKGVAYKAVPGTSGMLGAPYGAYLLPWNDQALITEFLEKKGEMIAAVVMEPVMGNAGVIPPEEGFLKAVRQATSKCGIVLIFDEVITGFRISRGGAQERYGIYSDITTLSKAMSGGVPLSAVGGHKDIMKLMENGDVFHGGVYSGNPLCLAAALAVQQEYDRRGDEIYQQLESISSYLARELVTIFADAGIPAVVQHVGAMLSLTFVNREGVSAFKNYRDVRRYADMDRYIRFQHALQDVGVYIHPNHFEPWYISTCHTKDVIDILLQRVEDVVKGLSIV